MLLTLNDLKRLFCRVASLIDPLVTYQEACVITGKSLPALYSKVSRSIIHPVKMRTMLRYSDVMRIKRKEV